MSEIWIEKCDNPKCGAEQRVESMVPTSLNPTWLYFMLEKGGKIFSFCGKCAAPFRELLKTVSPAAPPEMPPAQGRVQ